MAQAIVYDRVPRGEDTDNLLFSGYTLWFSRQVPQRTHFIQQAIANGASIAVQEKDADVLIVDHLRKTAAPGSYSYQWVERSIHSRELLNLDQFRVGITVRAERPVGSTRTPASTNTRRPFTEEEDQTLYNFVQPYREAGGSWKGNEIYKQMERRYPTHTFQSWRDRFIKKVSLESRTITEQIHPEDEILEVTRAESAQIDSRPAKRRRVQFQTDVEEVVSTNATAAVQPEERQASRRIVASSDGTVDQPEEQDEPRQDVVSSNGTTEQSEEQPESRRDLAPSAETTNQPGPSTVPRPPLAEIPSPSARSRVESAVDRHNTTQLPRKSVSQSPRSARRALSAASGEVKFYRTAQVHGFMKEEAQMLVGAVPTIISTPKENLERSWIAFGEEWPSHPLEEWRTFFDYIVVPEFMRRHGLKTEDQFHAHINIMLAAEKAKKDKSDAAPEEVTNLSETRSKEIATDEEQRRIEFERTQREHIIDSSTESGESDASPPRQKPRCTACHVEFSEAWHFKGAQRYCTECAWPENIPESGTDEESTANNQIQVHPEHQHPREDEVAVELDIADKTSYNPARDHSPVFEPHSPSSQRLINPKPNEGRKRASQSTTSNSLSQNSQLQSLPLSVQSQNKDEIGQDESSNEIPSTEVEAPSSVMRQRPNLHEAVDDDDDDDNDYDDEEDDEEDDDDDDGSDRGSLARSSDHEEEYESDTRSEPEAQSSVLQKPSQSSVEEHTRNLSAIPDSGGDETLQNIVSQEPPESGQRPPNGSSSSQPGSSAHNEFVRQQEKNRSGSESPLFVPRGSQDDDESDAERQFPRSPVIDLLGADEKYEETRPASSHGGASDTGSEYHHFEEVPERSQLWPVGSDETSPSEEESDSEDQFETARQVQKAPVSEDRFDTAKQVEESLDQFETAKRVQGKDTQAILRQSMDNLDDLSEHFLPPPEGGWEDLGIDETDESKASASDHETTPRRTLEVNETPQSQRHLMSGALQESLVDRLFGSNTNTQAMLEIQNSNGDSPLSQKMAHAQFEDETSSTITDDSEQARRDNEWFSEQQDRLIHHNLDEDMAYYMVSAAYMATCMKTTFATTVLNRMLNIYRSKGKREHRSLQIGDEQTAKEYLPSDLPGCWTEEDDRILMGKDARGIAKMETKHGEKNAKMRVALLEDLHNGN